MVLAQGIKRVLLLGLVVAVLQPVAAVADGFATIPADSKPKRTTRSNHYVISNEQRHYLFKDAIEDVGGVFVGVGSDQVYLMAGWARPKVLVPMDFDQFIVDLHDIYRLTFLHAGGPDDFLDLWKDKARVATLIDENAPSAKHRATLQKVLEFGHKNIAWRLKRLKKQYAKLGVGTFLSDRSQYDFLVGLFKGGKVFPVRGDLTKSRTLIAIGAAAKAEGLHVGAIYLSNAEQYFNFLPQYRKNIASLPFGGRSVVLRTLPDGEKKYTYYVQSLRLFQDWLERSKIKKVISLLKVKERVPGSDGRLFHLVSDPPKRWLK